MLVGLSIGPVDLSKVHVGTSLALVYPLMVSFVPLQTSKSITGSQL